MKYILTDDRFYLSEDGGEDSNRLLTSEDFEIYKLDFYIYSVDASLDPEKEIFVADESKTLDANTTATIYLKFGNGDFVEAATIDAAISEFNYNQDYVVSMTADTLTPQPNCVGYRIEYSNPYFYTEIDTVPYVKLKNSNYVLDTIENFDSISIRNENLGEVYDSHDTKIFGRGEDDEDFARSSARDS